MSLTNTKLSNRFLRLSLSSIFILQILIQQGDANACICPLLYDPVCGTDGNTYSNPCVLACQVSNGEGVLAAHKGSCAEDEEDDEGAVPDMGIAECACPYIYNPVCGTDGTSYSNPCLLACAPGNIKIASKGQCAMAKQREAASRMKEDKEEEEVIQEADDPTKCTCTKDLNYVCGSDGETYANQCLLRCVTGVKVVRPGKCSDTPKTFEAHLCACPKIFDQVCGVDGTTYSNLCLLECANVALKKRGGCFEAPESRMSVMNSAVCACPYILSPVCASDGMTYDNECLMTCKGEGLYVAHEGECERTVMGKPTTQKPLCFCPRYYIPVCGSDGVTYNNMCELDCQKDAGVTKVKEGNCDGMDQAAGFRSGRRFDPPPPTFPDDEFKEMRS